MKKIIESSVIQWVKKFLASIIIVLIGFSLLKFFPKDADEQIVMPIYTGSLGSAIFILACIGLLIDALRAWAKKPK